jgi:hypothetical protein
LAALSANLVNQDAPHGFGSSGEEVTTAVPLLHVLGIHQTDVGFVHQRRGLQRLFRLLVGQLLRRQPAQLFIDERQELRGGVGIALLDGRENAGNFTHGRHHRQKPAVRFPAQDNLPLRNGR